MSKYLMTGTATVAIVLSICSFANAGKGGGNGSNVGGVTHSDLTVQKHPDRPSVSMQKNGSAVKRSTNTAIEGESNDAKKGNR